MKFVEPIRERNKIELVKQILKENGSRDYVLFLMGINSGLRISDILKLKVKDVKDKQYIEINEQKTGKRKRFPVNDSFGNILQNYVTNKSFEDWLFPSQRGNNAITRVQAYRIISEACRKAGIKENTGTHTLRKTFGYHFYQKKQRYCPFTKHFQSFNSHYNSALYRNKSGYD